MDAGQLTAGRDATWTNRIDQALGRRRGLAMYLPLGDPGLPPRLHLPYSREGVDVIELGLPSGKPYLDGQLVGDSMKRALAAGTSLAKAALLSAQIRAELPSQALAWMAYPGEAAAPAFAQLAKSAKVDGVLVPTPPSSLGWLTSQLRGSGIPLLPFLGLSPAEVDIAVAREASGYVMAQAAPGRTGRREHLDPGCLARVAALREAGVTAPILVGFGVSTATHVQQALQAGANGVVVGSAALAAALRSEAHVRRLISSLREALDAG